MFDIVLAFISAFVVTFFAIPSIILVAKKKRLVDESGERRAHQVSTPSLGGIGIFAGVVFSIIMWTPFHIFNELQYILAAFIILFLIGSKDDIIPMRAWKKLIGQTIAAIILVVMSNVRIESFYGLFGLYELPLPVSITVSIFTILLIINAFNLIDGINGLSGSIALLISLLFGTWFFLTDHIALAIISFSLAGSIIAFLKYNFTPAKIFMGDTGSLLLGSAVSILAIKFLQFNASNPDSLYYFQSAPALAIAILIHPLYDTLRVFVRRAIKGNSPFKPDKNHIHHMLIELGLSHMQSTGVLVLTNLVLIVVAYKLRTWDSFLLLVLIFTIAIILSGSLYIYTNRLKESP